MCKEEIDLEDPESIEQLIQQVKVLPGCFIHCPIEFKPWSQWQRLNQRKFPRLSASIRQEFERSEEVLKQFIRVGNTCLDNGGDCSFEWPRYCSGWALPCSQEQILERNLRSATFDECADGVEADGKRAKKPWRFVSSSSRLVEDLAAQECIHTTHEPLQGKLNRMSAFYSRKFCEIMIHSLFPLVVNRHVWPMPCVARVQHPRSGYDLEEQPSCFHFPSLSLALSVFVDGLTFSRPRKNQSQFCSTLRKHVQLEESCSSGSGGSWLSLCKVRKAVTIDYAPVMRVNDPPAKL